MKNTATDYKKLYEQSLKTLEKERETSEQTLAEAKEILAEKEQQLSQKDDQINQLNFELDKFRKYIFGSKSEKLPLKEVDLSQMSLFDLGTPQQLQEDLSEQAASTAPQKTPKPRAKGTGRMKLPEHLRRETILIEPTEDVSDCICIGEEVTEVLELTPAEFYVKRYVRPKYARPNGGGILIGQLPERVIDKGIPSDGLIAQMILDKYVYGLPLHRQISKYRRLGENLPASTASDWIIKGWKHLVPLWELLNLLIANQTYVQVDESPIKVQDKGKANKIHKGYMWVYHAPVDKLVLFDYRKGRDRSGPREMLKGYEGILQTDGYSVYESLYGDHPSVALVYCMAHARRKFVDALKDDKAKAHHVLSEMQLLYKLEEDMREEGLGWEARTQRRQQEATPVLDRLETWLKEHALKTLPGSPLGKAIDYTLPRWKGLSAYVQHGQLEIDNNLVENAIRPLAIGRKNYLFAGSHDAAEATAAMYSFMATCKKNNVNELEWLTDVFGRIQSHKQKDLYQLLPNNWANYRDAPK
ncbi:IS66 family transposase [Fulvivirga sp. M361]|uniref:IS66 family transposase n=1 Tax=Fulvivirga sp. M361 TaxID=2594266 RepID=UPI00117BCF5D|nr:IS66 family transposase [Fulvivirga sp. M361]TRX54262.1 IS66 family transposase [Fulvivirga sp. M361]